jgi:hypothetical protein
LRNKILGQPPSTKSFLGNHIWQRDEVITFIPPPGKMKGIEYKVNVVNQCTGSSVFTESGTTVYCTIFGPMDAPHRVEVPNHVCLEVRWKESTIVQQKTLERFFSSQVNLILSKYIVSELDCYKMIQIHLNVFEKKRNTLFCAINACHLALVDAGIPLKRCFLAVSSGTHEEEVFVYGNYDGKFVLDYLHSFGEVTEEMELLALSNLKLLEEHVNFALKSRYNFD